MSDEAVPASGPQTIEHGGMTITSSGTGRSAEQIKADFVEHDKAKAAKEAADRGEEPSDENAEVAEAASKLGKKGGEAAAKARKAAAKEAKAEDSDDDDVEEDEGEAARKKVAAEIEAAKPHEKKKLASERVAEATRETAALKRQLEQMKKELEALRAPVRTPPPPDPQRFQGREQELQAAQLEHRVQQAIEKREQARMLAQAQAKRQSWIEVGSAVPHYLLGPDETPTQENFIATEIMSSPVPARLAVWFSEHKDEYQRIAALQTPREITREVAKIEGMLTAPAGTPVKPSVSKAPPPVRPVTGAPHTAAIWKGQNLSR